MVAVRILSATLALVASLEVQAGVNCKAYPNWEPVRCSLTKDGAIVVSQRSVTWMALKPDELGAIIVDKRLLYFVNRQGKTAPALPFDNGADYLVEGLARTQQNGKVGFVDVNLNVVVPPVWDFAFQFEHGRSVVCMGCVRTRADAGGEHFVMTGGKWGYIDKTGKVVVPVVYTESTLPGPDDVRH